MTRARIAIAGALMALASTARAAGPLLVSTAGVPLAWSTQPVPFNPDRGNLGTLSNATAVAQVAGDFAVWTGVSTASLSVTNAGALPVDVTRTNYTTYLDRCGDNLSPIIFDTDGTITDDLFGSGASNVVLGFAGPTCTNGAGTAITEGQAVLNGKWIDGISTSSNPEISVSEFDAVFVHEFGHYFDLDHSQIGLAQAFDGDPSNDFAVATMFPILVNPAEMATLALDDKVSISMLYPAASFATGFGTLTGSIFLPDGTSPFQGAYVVARKVGDPLASAVGMASGALFLSIAGGSSDPALEGRYTIPGLSPGNWTVEVEEIDPDFTGGSVVGPLDPPAPLPGPPEFWNGANEAAANPPDDPNEAVAIAVTAGTTTGGLDIVLNGVFCADTPATGCILPTAPGGSTLQLRKSPDGRDSLVWKWGLGPAATKADFGNPLSTTAYQLCVYDEVGGVPHRVVSSGAPAGGACPVRACWRETKSGFSYTDRELTPGGLSKMRFRPGDAGRTRIIVQGKGSLLGLPSLPLADDTHVRVQLLDSDGGCWEAVFGAPATVNDSERFKDASD